MIIFFDTINFNPSSGGVLQVSNRLLEGMLKIDGVDLIRATDMLGEIPKIAFNKIGRFGAEEYLSLMNKFPSDSSFIFPNYYLPFLLNGRYKQRSLVIVHDLQFLHLPQFFSKAKRHWLDISYKRLYNEAGKIVFISNSSRDDFVDNYGSRSGLEVIYNPIFVPPKPVFDKSIGSRYLLASYHYYPHKNFIGVLYLFKQMRSMGYSGELYITGTGRDVVNALINRYVPELREVIRHHGYLSECDLHLMQTNADAFVSLSGFEGFNLPAAECAALGVPLILSPIPVHYELFSNWAVFYKDEHDVGRVIQYIENFPREKYWEKLKLCESGFVSKSYAKLLGVA